MKKTFRKPFIIFGFIAVTSFFAFDVSDNYFQISKNIEIFSSVYKEVNTYYVDEIEASKLMRTGIDAMLKSLDPYTNYISESEVEDYRFMTTGQYGGIGAQIITRDKQVVIREPYEGWVAQTAGLRSGDIILEVDGKSAYDKNSDDVSKMLKGTAGTSITLKIKREGEANPLNFTFNRQEIKVKDVPYYGMINKNIGYIKFIGFHQEASMEVRQAVLELNKNPELRGIVLDVRGNPGGLLDEAIKTVNVFVKRNQMVVFTKGKAADWNKDYLTEEDPMDLNTPLVVITDKGSASAAEIVSGSLQDLDRAVIVGENSFGKGLVQTTRLLPYNTQLKVTTSKYYIPSGRCIQAIDYSHHDEDGKALKTPDSLKKAFKTKGGRTVFAGQGIKPDVLVDRTKYEDLVVSLTTKYLIFDYATQYRTKHESIAEADKFELSETDWNDFVAYLKTKNYEYTTDTETQLEKLDKSTKEEKYYDGVKSEMETLKAKLKAAKSEDVMKYKSHIKELLEDEIASRYYYYRGRVQSSFDNDKDIIEAVKILSDKDRYGKILTAEK
ncbi:MAG: S41 family peptidase [Bacteroidetes bacterium]|nr:S41 family peptidase [Bacteroidota bacterium]